MKLTEAEIRRSELEKELKQAMLDFETRRERYTRAKNIQNATPDVLNELAEQVDIALNAALEINRQLEDRI